MKTRRIFSWNVNGIRSVHNKGFLDWFETANADLVCLQEIKAKPEQLPEELLHPQGYHSFWMPADKPGYSGVAIYCKQEPKDVIYGLGDEGIDQEGRVLAVEYPEFVLLSSYFPNSQRGHARLAYKLEFCEKILQHCDALRGKGKSLILCGDFNIAHKEIDLKNPKTNQKNAGFLPEERAWMSRFLEAGYLDTFRMFNESPGHYTWWSYRPGVREKNIGWRLDYHCVNKEFKDRVVSSEIHPKVMGSDHCPVSIEIRR